MEISNTKNNDLFGKLRLLKKGIYKIFKGNRSEFKKKKRLTELFITFKNNLSWWVYVNWKLNKVLSKAYIRPYNLWIFFLNYSINYY